MKEEDEASKDDTDVVSDWIRMRTTLETDDPALALGNIIE